MLSKSDKILILASELDFKTFTLYIYDLTLKKKIAEESIIMKKRFKLQRDEPNMDYPSLASQCNEQSDTPDSKCYFYIYDKKGPHKFIYPFTIFL